MSFPYPEFNPTNNFRLHSSVTSGIKLSRDLFMCVREEKLRLLFFRYLKERAVITGVFNLTFVRNKAPSNFFLRRCRCFFFHLHSGGKNNKQLEFAISVTEKAHGVRVFLFRLLLPDLKSLIFCFHSLPVNLTSCQSSKKNEKKVRRKKNYDQETLTIIFSRGLW